MEIVLGEAVYPPGRIERAVFSRLENWFPWRRIGYVYLDANGANWMIGECRTEDISLMSHVCRFVAGERYPYG
jgi:hypothetical protein